MSKPKWGDVFQALDMVGQSEYNAIHDLLADVAELGSISSGPDPDDLITEVSRDSMLASIDELEAWCHVLRLKLKKLDYENMQRYVGIFYNNNGCADFRPISAKSHKEAVRVAEALAEQMGPGSGGTQFVVQVLLVSDFRQVAENVGNETKPFTLKELNDTERT